MRLHPCANSLSASRTATVPTWARRTCATALCSAFATFGVAPAALAQLPTGQTVVSGQASVVNTSSSRRDINVSSDKAIINWQSFSIGSGRTVQFNQPSASSVTLNRVTSTQASTIAGNLNANGRIFLVNPNGVVFGSGARVDVGGLMATTLNISNENFNAGNYTFAAAGTAGTSTAAAVSNAGQLKAKDGGFIILGGEQVTNSGTITTKSGTVGMAAGRQVSLDLGGSTIAFSVDGATQAANRGIVNTGTLSANGGSVVLSARAVGDLAASVVNHGGLIQAQSVGIREGRVVLEAQGGSIGMTGKIDVNASSGSARAGGVSLVAQGDIKLTGTSLIQANGAATGNSSGGTVYIWADGTSVLGRTAKIEARGGKLGGNGGFVELSGGHVNLRGKTDLTAPAGINGTLLIDPTEIVIMQGSGAATPGGCSLQVDCATIYEQDLETALRSGNVTLLATNASGDAKIRLSDLTANGGDGVLDGRNSGAGGGLSLSAVSSSGSAQILFDNTANTIRTDGAIHLAAAGTLGTDQVAVGNLTGSSVRIGSDISVINEVSTLFGSLSVGNLTANGAAAAEVTMRVYGPLTLGGNIQANSAGSANVLIDADNGIAVGTRTLSANGSNASMQLLAYSGAVTSSAGGTINASATSGLAEVALTAGSANLGGTVSALAGAAGTARTDIFSYSGNVALAGVSTSAGQGAQLNLSVSGDTQLNGPLSVTSSNGGATAAIGSYGNLAMSGTLNVTGNSNTGGLVSATLTSGGALTLQPSSAITVSETGAGGMGTARLTLEAAGNLTANSLSAASTTGDAWISVTNSGNTTLKGDINATGRVALAHVINNGVGTSVTQDAATQISATSTNGSSWVWVNAANNSNINLSGNLAASSTGAGDATITLMGSTISAGNLSSAAVGSGAAFVHAFGIQDVTTGNISASSATGYSRVGVDSAWGTVTTSGSISATSSGISEVALRGANLVLSQNISAGTNVGLTLSADGLAATGGSAVISAPLITLTAPSGEGSFDLKTAAPVIVANGGLFTRIDQSQSAIALDLTAGNTTNTSVLEVSSGGNLTTSHLSSTDSVSLTAAGTLTLNGSFATSGTDVLLRSDNLIVNSAYLATAPGATLQLVPYTLTNVAGVHSAGVPVQTNFSQALIDKTAQDVNLVIGGTTIDGLFAGDVHVGADGALNLGTRTLSVQTLGTEYSY